MPFEQADTGSIGSDRKNDYYLPQYNEKLQRNSEPVKFQSNNLNHPARKLKRHSGYDFENM